MQHELVRRAQQGDREAFGALVHGAIARLYASARLILRDPEGAEDAVQDALIAVHTKRHTYQRERPFRPWLAAIAKYKWIDRLRSMGRFATEELSEDLAVPDHESAVTSAIVLEGLLNRLKPAQAQAIRLVKLHGLSIEETAIATGQSESLVKVNIHRGLAKLQAAISLDSE